MADAHILTASTSPAESQQEHVAEACHDIRGCLSAAVGHLELLRSKIAAQGAGNLTAVREALGQIEALVATLEGEVDQRPQPTTEQPVTVGDFAGRLAAAFEANARLKSLQFRFGIDPQVRDREVPHPRRLSRILMNLLDNAVKYTDAGHVTLDVQRDFSGDRVIFQVADSGPGMAGWSAGGLVGARKAGSGGLGLGIVKRLADEIGAELRFASVEGEGTSAVVHLPMVLARTALAHNVLLIEGGRERDSELQGLLQLLGYRVTAVESGEECRRKLAVVNPDVVIMDLELPEASGLELVRHMRAGIGGNRRYWLGVNGPADVDARERALAAGFDEYLSKPLSLSVLTPLLRGLH